MRKTLAYSLSVLSLLGLALFQACSSTPEHADPYEVAGSVELPDVAPENREDLHNVFHLSDDIVSGGEPHSEEAFAHLAEMGVKTIVSVDGKTPDAETAARYGLRYVHVPIRYSGFDEDELLGLAKTFRELEGPFYVHCFHGVHRGPAAAAVGRVVLDGASREQAAAEMRQWCGTSEKYQGLYEAIVSGELPSSEETDSFAFDFPAAKSASGVRESMVVMSRAFDHLKALAGRDWQIDPSHPDLDSGNEAQILLDSLRQCVALDEVSAPPEDFRGWLGDALSASEELAEALDAGATGRAAEALTRIGESCKSCHAAYRNE